MCNSIFLLRLNIRTGTAVLGLERYPVISRVLFSICADSPSIVSRGGQGFCLTSIGWMSRCSSSSGQLRPGLYAKGGRFWGAGAKSENMYTTAIYMRQKSTNESRFEFRTLASNAASLQHPRFAYRQYASSFESQVFRGRPTCRVPKGCQESKR